MLDISEVFARTPYSETVNNALRRCYAKLLRFDYYKVFYFYVKKGGKVVEKRDAEKEFRRVGSLILNMAKHKAVQEEFERAFRQLLVAADAYVENLDYRYSGEKYGIAELEEKYSTEEATA